MLSMKRAIIDKMIIRARFPGFISAVDRIKNSNRKNAAPATQEGIISIIIPLKRIRLSATVAGENIERMALTVRVVRGVKIL